MKSDSRRKFLKNATLGCVVLGTDKVLMNTGFKSSRLALPIFKEVDICVIGGSCTGVFAAVRAARLGAKVAIVEKLNGFGGVATNGLVNIWHSLYDTEKKKQIIGGLTLETLTRLSKRDAAIGFGGRESYRLNTQELKIELDELVIENRITPFLNTLFSEPFIDADGNLTGVIVDNKSGRGIIKAKYFIDATGDADLCYRMGLKTFTHKYIQPPTCCAHLEGFNEGKFNEIAKEHRKEFNIPEGYIWGAEVPSTSGYMLAGTRIYNMDCSGADELTMAEIEGRRQIRAIMDLMRKYDAGNTIGLLSLPSYIGIRETRHVECLYQVSDVDAMLGRHFDDAIANGSYDFDLHHQEKPGNTFKYLDGSEHYSRPGYPDIPGRWRPETESNPTFYQVPLRSLIPKNTNNLIVAGRMLDAAMIAFSGIRVMVNMNQLGEAAGVTAYLALNQNKAIRNVSSDDVRRNLTKDGSIVI